MRYLVWSDGESKYPLCFLVSSIRKSEIESAYIAPFGIDPKDVLVLDLHYSQTSKKTPVKEIKEYITSELAPTLADGGVEYVMVTDADYFKVLTGATKVDVNLGYVMDSKYGNWKVVYLPSYRAIFYDPEKVKAKISQGMNAMMSHRSGSYKKPGIDIIHYEEYPQTVEEIRNALQRLLDMDCDLTCDIEGFDLKHHKAGIGTITFCWNQHEGLAFAVDYEPIPGATEAPFGRQIYNEPVRELLWGFFKMHMKKLIFHNIGYDGYVLIYQLYMADLIDTEGLLEGMSILMKNWDDTKLIAYLATNSCAGNKLSLKDLAQEFSGNYAETDIADITKIPLPNLLRYNLIDGLSTWYVHNKYYPKMVADDQLDIYNTLFKRAMTDIVQMQLTGMPLNMQRVMEVKIEMLNDFQKALDTINNTQVVKQFTYRLNEKWVKERNEKLKKKRVTMADAKEIFNPNSGPQLQDLLYEMVGLPVISLTDSKQPSTDADTLKNLRNHTQDPDILAFLNALLDYTSANTILKTFIPAMENAPQGPDGWHYMSGNFNLGGAVSGRLSSSDPNLQNFPANSRYAKLIKSCFQAPPGWLFCGLDFASLEDRISALTTKDPNKLKVYTDGYDGHAMRAVAYFGDQMPDIDPEDVTSVNSIAEKGHKYGPLRQESKAPTFALTYQGTFKTLMTNCGFSEEKAKTIEARYHELYQVSDKWVSDQLDEASRVGYITAAFGLRVRTPLLHQVVRNTSRTPYEAQAEGRTAGNALGQSWCLLNSRASAEFMEIVRASEHRLNIRPCAHIHDAQYMLVKDDIDAVSFANTHLVKAVQWQEHPAIAHPDVKLGGEFSIFYPTWVKEIGIPNGASQDDIYRIVNKYLASAE